jgi:hypothetical protein
LAFSVNRRNFLQTTAAAGLSSMFAGRFNGLAAEADKVSAVPKPTGSDVGSLFPFIQSQAVKGEFPLSFLNPRFRSLRSWKATARGKLLELLHYAPRRANPSPKPSSARIPAITSGKGLVQYHLRLARAGFRAGSQARAKTRACDCRFA